MKKNGLFLIIMLLSLTACTHRQGGGHGHPGDHDTLHHEDEYSALIPIDTANKMIQSYLDGINYTVNAEETRALVFNADSLRNYLSDRSIKDVKFVFAHTLDYANSPNAGKRPDSNTHVLTLILAGFDQDGNYVYKKNKVYDNLKPCPQKCPEGNAGQDLLIE